MSDINEGRGVLKIEKRVFFVAVAVLFVLMIGAGVTTLFLPSGSYVDGVYTQATTGGISFISWLTAPVMVLFSSDGLIVSVIIVFLLFLSASFALLSETGVMSCAVTMIAKKFQGRRYLMLWVLSFFFMALGSFLGIFEESVLLTPMVVALCMSMGFDVFTGLMISILATGLGFSAGVMNPFTTGVAQTVVGLELFSGIWMRIIAFIVIYLILMAYVTLYSKRTAKKMQDGAVNTDAITHLAKRGLMVFVAFFIIILLWVTFSGRIGMADYTMPALAVLFLLGGIGAAVGSKLGLRKSLKTMGKGILGMAPGIVLILMAVSIKHIMVEAQVLDTILYRLTQVFSDAGPYSTAVGIYIVVLVLEIFIASGSAKAFLIMPIAAGLATASGLSLQSTVLSFLFGDGLSNVFYITNPVLLITLGLTGTSYLKWIKKTWPVMVGVFTATVLLLIFAISVGY